MQPEQEPVVERLEPAADHSWPAVRGRLTVLWHAARVTVGILLCFVGVLGTLLPVIPGVPLIIAGVAVLGTDHWLVRAVRDRVARWLPRR